MKTTMSLLQEPDMKSITLDKVGIKKILLGIKKNRLEARHFTLQLDLIIIIIEIIVIQSVMQTIK